MRHEEKENNEVKRQFMMIKLHILLKWNGVEDKLKERKKLIIMKILDIRLNEDEAAEKVVRILYTLLMSRIRILYI